MDFISQLIDNVASGWEVVSVFITILSSIITLISWIGYKFKSKNLNASYFQLREIYLHIQKNKETYANRSTVESTEVVALIDGYEGMAAAGMHNIKPRSFSEKDKFYKTKRVFDFFIEIKHGVIRVFRS
jgi:amino acid permease